MIQKKPRAIGLVEAIVLMAIACFLIGVNWDAKAQPGLIINGQGTATLSWVLPTQNVDGSPIGTITNIGVFHGQSRFSAGTTLRAGCASAPTSLTSTTCYAGAAAVGNGTATGAPLTLTLNTAQTVYFAAAVQVAGGAISAYSNEAAKQFVLQVNAPPGAPTLTTVDVEISCTTNLPEVTCTLTVQ